MAAPAFQVPDPPMAGYRTFTAANYRHDLHQNRFTGRMRTRRMADLWDIRQARRLGQIIANKIISHFGNTGRWNITNLYNDDVLSSLYVAIPPYGGWAVPIGEQKIGDQMTQYFQNPPFTNELASTHYPRYDRNRVIDTSSRRWP